MVDPTRSGDFLLCSSWLLALLLDENGSASHSLLFFVIRKLLASIEALIGRIQIRIIRLRLLYSSLLSILQHHLADIKQIRVPVMKSQSWCRSVCGCLLSAGSAWPWCDLEYLRRSLRIPRWTPTGRTDGLACSLIVCCSGRILSSNQGHHPK